DEVHVGKRVCAPAVGRVLALIGIFDGFHVHPNRVGREDTQPTRNHSYPTTLTTPRHPVSEARAVRASPLQVRTEFAVGPRARGSPEATGTGNRVGDLR